MGSKLPISVIIPCYQCASTIDVAVESVLRQTYLPSEIWLVDDGSGDDTLASLRRIEQDYPDLVRVFELPENSGPGIARNAGWDNASGTWIAFLDADDSWHPQKLEIQWQWLQHHPEVVLCGHQSRLLEQPIEMIEGTGIETTEISLTTMLISNQLPTRSVMIKKELPFRFGGKDVSEDYLLWLEVITAHQAACKLEVCLAYTQRPEHSVGGYSGNLWKHEKRELKSLATLRSARKLKTHVFVFTCLWSITKYIRRLLKRKLQGDDAKAE